VKKGRAQNTSCPGNFDQEHQAEPAQATSFDKVGMGTAYRVAIDAASLDLSSPAALDRIIQSDQERTGRGKRPH
jgi:hypothetical protein